MPLSLVATHKPNQVKTVSDQTGRAFANGHRMQFWCHSSTSLLSLLSLLSAHYHTQHLSKLSSGALQQHPSKLSSGRIVHVNCHSQMWCFSSIDQASDSQCALEDLVQDACKLILCHQTLVCAYLDIQVFTCFDHLEKKMRKH